MKSRKCSKIEVHQVLARVLRKPRANIERKKIKKMKKVKLEAVVTMRKNWQILNNLCNLCFVVFLRKEIS